MKLWNSFIRFWRWGAYSCRFDILLSPDLKLACSLTVFLVLDLRRLKEIQIVTLLGVADQVYCSIILNSLFWSLYKCISIDLLGLDSFFTSFFHRFRGHVVHTRLPIRFPYFCFLPPPPVLADYFHFLSGTGRLEVKKYLDRVRNCTDRRSILFNYSEIHVCPWVACHLCHLWPLLVRLGEGFQGIVGFFYCHLI